MVDKPLCIRTFTEALQVRMNVKVFEKNSETGLGIYKNFRKDIHIYSLLLESLTYGVSDADSEKLSGVDKTLISRLQSREKDVPNEYLAQTQRKHICEDVGEYFAKTLTSPTYITKESLTIAVDTIAYIVENDAALGKTIQSRLKKLKKDKTASDYLAEVWVLAVKNNKNCLIPRKEKTQAEETNKQSDQKDKIDSELSQNSVGLYSFPAVDFLSENIDMAGTKPIYSKGKIIANEYEIIEKIGEGNNGIAYKTKSKFWDKIYTIKSFGYRLGSYIRFKELCVLKCLDHKFLPKIRDIVPHDGLDWLVMEYIDGIDLNTCIKSVGALSVDEIIKKGFQLCEVVAYLHSLTPPVIHGDIKPSNIMIKKDNSICLIDYNLSREIDIDPFIIPLGISRGYAAPETYSELMFDDNGFESHYLSDTDEADNEIELTCEYSVLSDIYSIGATLYYLATAVQPPYLSADALKDTEIDCRLLKIIQRCSATKPEERYQTAEEVLKELRKIKAKGPVNSRLIDLLHNGDFV